jgi:hypothetical protein
LILLATSDNPVQTEHLRRGLELFGRAESDAAIRHLTIAWRANSPFSDLSRLRLAQVLHSQGAPSEGDAVANDTKTVRSAHGGFPVFTDDEYRSVMQRVAAEHSVPYVDVRAALEEDPSVFLDMCHPDARGHRKIAAALLPAVQAALSDAGRRPYPSSDVRHE